MSPVIPDLRQIPAFPRPSSRTGVRLRALAGVVLCALSLVGGMAYGPEIARAAAGQYLKLVTSDGGSTFYVGRCFRTNFEVQTDNLDANSVDIVLPYSPAYVQPFTNSGCTTAATSILTTGTFPSYPSNAIAGNQVQVIAYDPSGSDPVNTGAAPADRVLGYLYWKVMSASGTFNMRYSFTAGSTTDTNMAEDDGDGTDVLEGVENLSLTLSADNAGPTFTSLSPANGAAGVSVTSGISYVFSDAGAGINSGSLTTKLNALPLTLAKSGCTTTNSNRKPSCNVSANPGTLSYNTFYRVTATGGDLAVVTNTGSQSWTFTTEDDDDAPYVDGRIPGSGSTSVALASDIEFHVKDYKNGLGVTPGLGVDLSTVLVTVTVGSNPPVTYDSGDAEFSFTGTPEDYAITIDPVGNFPEDAVVHVTVNASDLHGSPNVMAPVTYSFHTLVPGAPSAPVDSGSVGGDAAEAGGRRGAMAEISEILRRTSGEGIIRITLRRRADGTVEILTPEEERAVEQCLIDNTGRPATVSFRDVPSDAWYIEALMEFVRDGIVDGGPNFRPADGTQRAEIAKMLNLILPQAKPFTPPEIPSFDDAPITAWYYRFLEQAASRGWVRGYDNCYGTRPCEARPGQIVSRAEEAAMIVRMLDLKPTGKAKIFPDVQPDAWYAQAVQTAADHGILLGDGATGLAAPERPVNRAESILMLSRARAYFKANGAPLSAFGASLLGTAGGAAASLASVLAAIGGVAWMGRRGAQRSSH